VTVLPSTYSLRDVALAYPSRSGKVAAVHGVNLDIVRGERIGILGASGAGKSTLLRLLNATLRPTLGSVQFEGENLGRYRSRDLRKVRRRIGIVFQQPQLVPSFTSLQNALCGKLGSWSLLRSVRAIAAPSREERESAFAALDTVGLANKANVRADELSGGQQQRVAIARVLVQDPDVVLADEPFSALDPGLTEAIAGLLFGVAAQKRTLIAALHDVEVALAHCQRIVGMREGRIVFDLRAGEVTPERLRELYARPRAGAREGAA